MALYAGRGQKPLPHRKASMTNAKNATQFGKHDFTFEYEATSDQLAMLAEEAIANSVKSAICAGVKGKYAAIDDRKSASASDITLRFPSEVRGVKVKLGVVSDHVESQPKDPVAQATKALGAMTAEQKAAFLASIQAAMESV